MLWAKPILTSDQNAWRIRLMPLIDLIVGARPNFMKAAPVLRALQTHNKEALPEKQLNCRLIHTGQHYDTRMSEVFFSQLRIPEPDINLNVGSASHAKQVAGIMTAYETVILESGPDLCMVFGDVNSTIACAITAKKENIPVAHVEAGIRSGDRTMPEEINRIATDSITDWYFTTSLAAGANLLRAGATNEQIFFVGNTMIDTLLSQIGRARPPILTRFNTPEPGSYFLLTLHRPTNVDDLDHLSGILSSIGESAPEVNIFFPVHPRSIKQIESLASIPNNIILIEPQPYLEFIWLLRNTKAIITDSGGITEEATVLGVPCITMRDSTERPETITLGTNELVGSSPEHLRRAIDRVRAGQWKKASIPEKWDGKSGERIALHIRELLA